MTDQQGIFGYPALPQTETKLSDPDLMQSEVLDQHEPKSATRFILDEARFNDSWKWARWQGYSLPGQDPKLKTCGKWFFKGCLNLHLHEFSKIYLRMVQKECCRSCCSLCVESWANRIANRMTTRISKWAEITHKKASHVIISLPKDRHNIPLKDLKHEIKLIKKLVGINASADVLHPFRFSISKGTPKAEPHIHCIVFGWIQNTKEVYELTGYLVKKISTLKNEIDVFRTSKYILTHAGIKTRRHAVVYTGNVSYSKLKLQKEDIEPVLCPGCNEELVDLRISPQYMDKPPPFEVGFVGFTDFQGMEVIEDYDNHYYDEDWTITSSRQENLKRQALRQKLDRKKARIKDKLDLKLKYCQKLENFIQDKQGLIIKVGDPRS